MQESFGYILRQRPFRDNSVLLDIFTEDFGRICCVARPAKKRGKIVKGNLEQFRYLKLQWFGKGDVQTLAEADERGRHVIPPSEIMLGLYLNELILLFTQQHVPQEKLFSAYKYTLHKIGDPLVNRHILMRFEVYLLAILGFPLTIPDKHLSHQQYYRFTKEFGLTPISKMSKEKGISISADLLIALLDMPNMQESYWKILRVFLDQVFIQIAPRAINTRKLLNL